MRECKREMQHELLIKNNWKRDAVKEKVEPNYNGDCHAYIFRVFDHAGYSAELKVTVQHTDTSDVFILKTRLEDTSDSTYLDWIDGDEGEVSISYCNHGQLAVMDLWSWAQEYLGEKYNFKIVNDE